MYVLQVKLDVLKYLTVYKELGDNIVYTLQ